ncbi:hypothetical protein U0070_025437 [Myodes glareolus]|uniref:Uncharacterized protein n=1 Tax=Myodes glareolus TaxID=447135 RepID=A0AAW0IXN3_MYOGA
MTLLKMNMQNSIRAFNDGEDHLAVKRVSIERFALECLPKNSPADRDPESHLQKRGEEPRDEMTSLAECVSHIKEAQKSIYCIASGCMTEPADGYCIQQLKEFDGKILVLRLWNYRGQGRGENGENKLKFEHLCKPMKEILDRRVEKMTISTTLYCDKHLWMDSQHRLDHEDSSLDSSTVGYMVVKKHLEIKPDRPIVEAKMNKNDKAVEDLVVLLFETVLLSCGLIEGSPNPLLTASSA